MNFNYRVTWRQGAGYRGEWIDPEGWVGPIGPYRPSHVEANLDCLLNHRLISVTYTPCATFNLDPTVNLEEGA